MFRGCLRLFCSVTIAVRRCQLSPRRKSVKILAGAYGSCGDCVRSQIYWKMQNKNQREKVLSVFARTIRMLGPSLVSGSTQIMFRSVVQSIHLKCITRSVASMFGFAINSYARLCSVLCASFWHRNKPKRIYMANAKCIMDANLHVSFICVLHFDSMSNGRKLHFNVLRHKSFSYQQICHVSVRGIFSPFSVSFQRKSNYMRHWFHDVDAIFYCNLFLFSAESDVRRCYRPAFESSGRDRSIYPLTTSHLF